MAANTSPKNKKYSNTAIQRLERFALWSGWRGTLGHRNVLNKIISKEWGHT